MSIKDFINNIIVDRFPVGKEIKNGGKYSDVNVIINVSDEYYLGNSEEIMLEGKLNYYFPMGELSTQIGLNSIYGALQVLYQIYLHNPDWKILLHCQAGKNRSPTVKSAFHYMMLSEHSNNSRLVYNCDNGHLPRLDIMEDFLKNCKHTYDNSHLFLGGMFDWVIDKSKLNKQNIN